MKCLAPFQILKRMNSGLHTTIPIIKSNFPDKELELQSNKLTEASIDKLDVLAINNPLLSLSPNKPQ